VLEGSTKEWSEWKAQVYKRTIENVFLPLKMKNVFYLLACFCIDHKRSFMLRLSFSMVPNNRKGFPLILIEHKLYIRSG